MPAGAEVIDLFIKLYALVLVIAGRSGRDRRKRQRSVDEVVGQAREIGLRRRCCGRFATGQNRAGSQLARTNATLSDCRMYLLQIFRFAEFGAFQAAGVIAEQSRKHSARAHLNKSIDAQGSQLSDDLRPANRIRDLMIQTVARFSAGANYFGAASR